MSTNHLPLSGHLSHSSLLPWHSLNSNRQCQVCGSVCHTIEASNNSACDDESLGLAHFIRGRQQHQYCVAVGDAHREHVAQHIGATNATHVIRIIDERIEKLV